MNTFSGPPNQHKMGRDMGTKSQHDGDMASGRRMEHKRADTDLPNLKKAIKLNDYE